MERTEWRAISSVVDAFLLHVRDPRLILRHSQPLAWVARFQTTSSSHIRQVAPQAYGKIFSGIKQEL